MNRSKIIPVMMLLGGISLLALSCAPKQTNTTTTVTEEVAVQRGNLSVDITAVGNLALSTKQDLAFEIPGTVEDVLVEEGDSVEKGQVLARLDTTEWDKQLTTLERAVLTAERAVTTAQKQLRDKQTAVTTAQNNVTSKEYALRQAQLDYQSANETLNQVAEIKKVQDKIDDAEYTIRVAKGVLSGNFTIGMAVTVDNYWTDVLRQTQTQLAQLQIDKQALLTGNNLIISTTVQLDIAKKQLAVEQKLFGLKQAQLDLDNAKVALEDAKAAIAPAEVDVKNAQADLKTAQQNLADARKNAPDVKAPFAGFITKVNVEGGDEVKKGTIAVTIADPNKFEADVMVSEMDISRVKLGGAALLELQAAFGTTYSANITHIAPTATVQQSVVNYRVTVEVGAPQIAQTIPRASTNATATAASGNFSQAVPFTRPGGLSGSANITQEQINQRIQQRQQAFGGAAPTQEQLAQMRQQFLAGQAQTSGGQTGRTLQTAASSTNIRLSEGMTVTVTIPVESRINALLAPNGAITTKSGQATVTVVKPDGTNEERAIQTGISNWQYTEVISGLTEGEKVLVKKSTSSGSSTSSSTNRPSNQTLIPGVRVGGR